MATPLKELYNASFFAAYTQAFPSHVDFTAVRELPSSEKFIGAELRQRQYYLTEATAACLPKDLKKAKVIIEKIVSNLRSVGIPDFNFHYLFLNDLVTFFPDDRLEDRLDFLKCLTIFSSAEFAIRHLIMEDEVKTLAYILPWSDDPNPLVRRLITEGTRPRLPWGVALKSFQKDPSPMLPTLKKLISDPADTVRLSVSNHLNDISKDHPELVLHWIESSLPSANISVRKNLKHAARTLLKKGDQRALSLFGHAAVRGQLSFFELTDTDIYVGGHLVFDFSWISHEEKPAQIRIEYAIDFLRKDGSHHRKVFKISEKALSPGEHIDIPKRHSFRKITTRTFYDGLHRLSVLINGQVLGTRDFRLSHP